MLAKEFVMPAALQDPDIEPPPPRVAYVDALAAALVRAKPEKDKERSS